jgi:hypothetical protein
MPQSTEALKRPFTLKYEDYKSLERIIEDYNFDEQTKKVDFNRMSDDEKTILWKIKTIIRNMESVRLRVAPQNQKEE